MALTDRTGRNNPFTAMLRDSFDAMLRQMYFCLPGKVLTFDPETQLAQVQCGIQMYWQGEPQTVAPIDNVPVHFSGNDSFYLWHEITPGTEGLIHFSQRALDDWIERGGPVAPTDRRFLSAADAFFVPGVRSKPGVIPNFKNEGAGISNYDGTSYVHVTGAGTEVENNMTIAGDLDVDGDITATGNISADGNIEAAGNITAVGDVVAGTISLKTHVHGGVTSGPSTTGVPQ